MLPCLRFEDDDLLVVEKPAGWNTHAASPYGSEGIYDWLRNREPRWASLAILHRLDKETSGLLVFGKTRSANQGLSRQFEARQVAKKYRFLTEAKVGFTEKTVRSSIVRAGNRYLCRPVHAGAPTATTQFRRLGTRDDFAEWEAEPLTGLTHQIRVHATSIGLPIVGDELYAPPPRRPAPDRCCLHASELSFRHPTTAEALHFVATPAFTPHGPWRLREAFLDRTTTDAYRVVHGPADRASGLILERWGEVLLWQRDRLPSDPTGESLQPPELVREALDRLRCTSVYHQDLVRQLKDRTPELLSPRWLCGKTALPRWQVRENGVRFEVRFDEGYSVGLFLDQRDNRRRFLANHVARDFPLKEAGLHGAEVLNTFAYTCGFSVCAALSGATTTSIDLSRKALSWGQDNFRANGLNPNGHAFLSGDVFAWLKRLRRRQRQFDVVILDPPTFSRTKQGRVFRADKDYAGLIRETLPLLKNGGVLLASVNTARLGPEAFVKQVESAVGEDGRQIAQGHYAPPPPDFPAHRDQPAQLKSLWVRITH